MIEKEGKLRSTKQNKTCLWLTWIQRKINYLNFRRKKENNVKFK